MAPNYFFPDRLSIHEEVCVPDFLASNPNASINRLFSFLGKVGPESMAPRRSLRPNQAAALPQYPGTQSLNGGAMV